MKLDKSIKNSEKISIYISVTSAYKMDIADFADQEITRTAKNVQEVDGETYGHVKIAGKSFIVSIEDGDGLICQEA